MSTIAQQKPPTKPVANIISTLLAKTVTSHEAEKGIEVTRRTLLRPNFIAIPPNIPPNRAPSRERLATHDACCWLIVKVLVKFPVCIAKFCFSCKEAIAGEL
jgi:hypothetical protein